MVAASFRLGGPGVSHDRAPMSRRERVRDRSRALSQRHRASSPGRASFCLSRWELRWSIKPAASTAFVMQLGADHRHVSQQRCVAPRTCCAWSMLHDRLLGDDAARASGNGNGGSTSDRRRSNGRGTGRDLALRGRKLGTVPGDASGESPEALRMVDASRREILTSLAVQPFRRATHGGTHTGGSPVALRSGGAAEPDVCARAGRPVLAGVARQAATDERCGAPCEPLVGLQRLLLIDQSGNESTVPGEASRTAWTMLET